MTRLVPLVLRPWALPLIVLALIAPAIAAFSLVGPALGLAVGALTVAAVLVFAARARFDEAIEVAPTRDRRYRLLVVTAEPLDDPGVIDRVASIASEGEAAAGARGSQVRVLAPARASRLDRWASDLEPARAAARRTIAVSLGTLAAAGLEADGRVGDEDAVQAIEDELRAYAAREIVLVDGPGLGAGELEEVRRRLDRPVRRV
jgi:hypothetical protein